jgi:hypothetical protein
VAGIRFLALFRRISVSMKERDPRSITTGANSFRIRTYEKSGEAPQLRLTRRSVAPALARIAYGVPAFFVP